MGLLDRLRGKGSVPPVRKHAERVANKRAQAPDRWESIQALAQMGTAESAEALLPRFTFYVDPSITDQEEKDAAFEAVVQAGDVAVEPVVRFLRRAESISWPLKMLDKLLSPEEVISRLLDVLSSMDTEYERDPQRKIQVLAVLEERCDPRAAAAVERFLFDANETVRFTAVGAVAGQAQCEDVKPALERCLLAEESVRVRARILDAFVARNWTLTAVADAQPKLPSGYAVDKSGHPRRL